MIGKVYISGAITQDPEFKGKFEFYACMLKSMGYEVVNPAIYERAYECMPPKQKWYAYMQRDLAWLRTCTHIFYIEDMYIHSSSGVRIERRYAKRRHIATLYIDGLCNTLVHEGR